MEITIEIPEYTVERGFRYKWEKDLGIEAKIENGAINIKANREGLISLANHLLNLAQESIPSGYHLHLDQYNSLKEGSVELIIQKE